MKSKDIIIILSRLRDIVESESENSKLTLTKDDAKVLFNYLKEIKKQHEKDTSFIQIITTETYRYNNGE